MARAEPCPVPGCLDPKQRGHLMCRGHWRSLPALIRGAVWNAWKPIREPWTGGDHKVRLAAIAKYRTACQAAIDFITNKENTHVAS